MSTVVAILVGMLVSGLGVGGLVLVVLAAHPEKVQLWAAIILKVVRRVTKRAELAYVATDVASQINSHLASQVLPELGGLTAKSVSIRWTHSGEAVASERAGTVIVRLRQHEDRVANTLHAYLAAVPRLFAPTIRSQLAPHQSRAIDLQLCRKLADTMSREAITVYRLDVLDPLLQDDDRLGILLGQLQTIDIGGMFVPVLLQELITLSGTYPVDALPGLSEELQELVLFLKRVAERERGTEIELSFLGRYVRINILLVARRETRQIGVDPYRSRIGIELAKGVETCYVMATEANATFASEVAAALDGDRRLIRGETRRVRLHRDGQDTTGIVIPFERNLGYDIEDLMSEAVRTGEFGTGTVHAALVTDVQPSYVGVDISGVQGVIPRDELSHFFVDDCRSELSVGDELEVQIVEAIPQKQEMIVSRRACMGNPLDTIDCAALVGSEQVMVVTARGGRQIGRYFLAGYLKDFPAVPVRLAEGELEWGAPLHGVSHIANGEEVAVVVLEAKRERAFLSCSRKRRVADKWEIVRSRFANGSRLTVLAKAVRPEGVWCEIEPGLSGFIPASEFRQAGLEYSNFERNVRAGQELFVYVTRVVAGDRQRVNLGLQRNLR